MKHLRVAVIGGGAAGFFAAITAAQSRPGLEVAIFEKGPQFLSKVRISGGGRCNVTHACFDPRELTSRFPRGEQALIAPFHVFQARQTIEWFEARGVRLKTEDDGRMFPVSDSSQTVIDSLIREAQKAGVALHNNQPVEQVSREGSTFRLTFKNGDAYVCDRLVLATGGCRTPAMASLATSLGHTLEPPVPSLFSFHIAVPWLRSLAGISVPSVEASVAETRLVESGPLLITHSGVSGPAILRLSAWGARILHERDYNFDLRINWLPAATEDALRASLLALFHTPRLVINSPQPPIPARLWKALVGAAGITDTTRWANLGKTGIHNLTQQLRRTTFAVNGKSLNKDEFVTCGGVQLSEVNFKTMESRVCPSLYLAGELLDIDGITGGFNFQAAWTTGWLAGKAIAQS